MTNSHSHRGPGKYYRQGLNLIELMQKFPDELSATKWIESIRWLDGKRECPACGSSKSYEVKAAKPMPYRCLKCKKYFSARTGTIFARSHIPLQKWAIAIYLVTTSLKGVSSMKLHRDLGITQKSAWFMLNRIREAFDINDDQFSGTVEVDETYMGGLERNKHENKKLKQGRGATGKTAVIGVKERESKKVKAEVIHNTKRPTLHRFIDESIEPGSTVYTDDFKSYEKLDGYEHQSVKHSVGEYVDEQIHINGMESFWSMLKRAHKGVYHKMSVKHLDRYVQEFAGRHNIREHDTITQMQDVVAGTVGKRLMYSELVNNAK